MSSLTAICTLLQELYYVVTCYLPSARPHMNEPVIKPVQLVRMEIRDAPWSAARKLGYANLKPEQLDVVEAFVKGCDVYHAPNWLWKEPFFWLPSISV